MNDPEAYVRANYYQKQGVQDALQEFTFDWRCDGRDSILDAGCGPGDVTVDILMPILPANFSRLVGVDISNEMIDYARETYVHPKLSFKQFDLSKDLEKQPFRRAKPFDHVFSFYVLMWISNLETCIRNFYKLLAPNGNLFLLTPAKHPVYDTFKAQSLDKRWAKYIPNIDDKMSPFSSTKYLNEDSCDMLRKHGFTDCEVKFSWKNTTYKNVASLRAFFQAVHPYLYHIPVKDRELFIDDVTQQAVKNSIRPNGDGIEDEVILSHNDVAVYAKKKGKSKSKQTQG